MKQGLKKWTFCSSRGFVQTPQIPLHTAFSFKCFLRNAIHSPTCMCWSRNVYCSCWILQLLKLIIVRLLNCMKCILQLLKCDKIVYCICWSVTCMKCMKCVWSEWHVWSAWSVCEVYEVSRVWSVWNVYCSYWSVTKLYTLISLLYGQSGTGQCP